MYLISSFLTKKQHNKQAEQFSYSVFGSFSEIMRVCGYERINDFAIIYGQTLNTTCETIMQVQKNIADIQRAGEANRKILEYLKTELDKLEPKVASEAAQATELGNGEPALIEQEAAAAEPQKYAVDVLEQLFE